jgi:hypothetical protein
MTVEVGRAYEALLDETTFGASDVFVRPHSSRSVWALADIVLDAASSSARGVVVVALDGVSWSSAAAVWETDELLPLTSTFPSTSVSAWLSAVTGTRPESHGIVGPVFRDPATGRMVNALAPRPRDGNPVVGIPTIFDAARNRGMKALAYQGDMEGVRGWWTDAVLRGAEVIAQVSEREHLLQSAQAIVLDTCEGIDRGIEAVRDRGLIWAHANVDEYVHDNGYDADVAAALSIVEERAKVWVRQGFSVILCSDHGLVPSGRSAKLYEAWDSAIEAAHCHVGGAGRVMWLYPDPDDIPVVRDRLGDALGESALVCTVDDLLDEGLWQRGSSALARIGGVVAVATSPDFPAPGHRRFDHGSWTAPEMVAPCAIWRSP